MKPDLARIEALEQELLEDPPQPVGEMRAYLLLVDIAGRDASDRVPVSLTVEMARPGHVSFRIKGGPFSLIPTRVGTLRAVVKFDDGASWMPACSPDATHEIGPGDTFTVIP